jgi:hypothetical protein
MSVVVHNLYCDQQETSGRNCFGSAETTAADFSQTSLKISYVSQKVLSPPQVKCGVASGRPAFMGGLSPPALYQLVVPARHAENVTNIGLNKISAPTKISLIFAKL